MHVIGMYAVDMFSKYIRLMCFRNTCGYRGFEIDAVDIYSKYTGLGLVFVQRQKVV